MGYDTTFTDKFNDISVGALYKGNIAVDAVTTPFLNLWTGPTYNRKITMLQGI